MKTKKENVFNGNIEITKENQKEWNEQLKGVTAINGNLYIYSNCELKALTSVGGNLYIYSNCELKAEALTSVGGYLYIYSNVKGNIKCLKKALDSNDMPLIEDEAKHLKALCSKIDAHGLEKVAITIAQAAQRSDLASIVETLSKIKKEYLHLLFEKKRYDKLIGKLEKELTKHQIMFHVKKDLNGSSVI